LLLLPGAAHATISPLDTLKAGYWYQVPNSHMRDVMPTNHAWGQLAHIMDAWSGGAYDTKRDWLLINGGGHGDYSGNDTYAFSTDSLKWTRIFTGTDSSIIPSNNSNPAYVDGNPASRHTYDGLTYLPDQDAMFMIGGSIFNLGTFYNDAWSFGIADTTWTGKAGYGVDLQVMNYVESDYDPVSKKVLAHMYGLLKQYDPVADTWSEVGSASASWSGIVAAHDYKRNKFVVMGNGTFVVYNLNDTWPVTGHTTATTGDTAIVSAPVFPGFVYDPVADRMVAWGGNSVVYTLNMDTMVWTRHLPAAGNTVTPPAQATQGTHGRFQYVPSKNVYVAVNDIDQDVYFYKLPFITRIDLPLDRWVGVPIPAADGASACRFGGCKHIRTAYNSADSLSYWMGGDHDNQGSGWTDSGSNEMWTYSIKNDAWNLVMPYCLDAGDVHPAHPDEVGWAYDSRRNRFWMYPGYMGTSATCPPSWKIGGESMRFDVATSDWDSMAIGWEYPMTLSRFSVYDYLGDKTLSFNYNGDNVTLHYLANDSVAIHNTIIPTGEGGGSANVREMYSALDEAGQKLYVMDATAREFYAYDMATDTLHYLGVSPDSICDENGNFCCTGQIMFWDDMNKLVLWPRRGPADGVTDFDPEIRMHVYHPDTNTWETLPIQPPVTRAGYPLLDESENPYRVIGRNGYYDPVQNVLAVVGTGQSAGLVPYLYLYRYGNGAGTYSEGEGGGGTPGISLTRTSGLVTTEAGVADTFRVYLDTEPTANVTIGISSDDTSEGTVLPSSLTFTSANWSTPQVVTATGVNDADVDGDIQYHIVTAAATSSDGNYSGINAADVTVTNLNDDVAAGGGGKQGGGAGCIGPGVCP
jgi:hypothetical protein